MKVTYYQQAKPLCLRGLRRIPHSVVFAFVNLAYCLPVFFAYILGFSEGGVGDTLDIDPEEIFKFLFIYFASILSFHFGAWFIWKFPVNNRDHVRYKQNYAQNLPQNRLKILMVIMCIGLIITKIMLIPKGVYGEYVFDSGAVPDGGVWSASMFFSESLIILIFAMIIATRTPMSVWVIVPFCILCVNLLHGTRIFVTATLLGVIIYLWLSREISKKLLASIFLGLVLSLMVLFVAFVSRTDYRYSENATGLTIALSPIIYESVFSQMSLLGYLRNYSPGIIGSPLGFLLDAISFIIPRFINPDKNLGTVLEPYFYLNPLGAFSGHAAGLIYFGYSMFLFYFFLGGIGSWLQRLAKKDATFFVIYLYFTGDILFRLMRDGYILPVKYFSNGWIIIFIGLVQIYPRVRKSSVN